MKMLALTFRVLLVLVLCTMGGSPAVAAASTSATVLTKSATNNVFITEVQTASAASAGEEFVELYNNTDSDIDFADSKDSWKLQYFSSSKFSNLVGPLATEAAWSAPSRTITLTGTIAAHDYYVLAAGTYAPGNIEPNQNYTSTLADEGALQLIDTPSSTSTVYHDRVLWSHDTTLPGGSPLVPAPTRGASVQRIPNENMEYINEDGSFTPFAVKPDISPLNPWQETEVVESESTTTEEPAPEEVVDDTASAPTEELTTNEGLAMPRISELLANPASPQTDENDEFIELYNPNSQAFNLKGYTLETGTTTLHDFTFTSETLLEPNGYMAFYASQTHLSLSNSGGQARLLDSSGAMLSQTDAYGTASDGTAWAFDTADGTWKWTTTPTPAAENVVTTPVIVVKTASSPTPAKKTATAKVAVAKVKGTTTAKAKKVTTTKKAKAAAATKVASSTPARPPAPIHAGVLAAVAALAVAYGVYEYRHDLANRIHQFRTNRTARRSARK